VASIPERIAVSVVVCAYNEGRHLDRLLASLECQTLQPREVIVVDDGSTDRTAAIAMAYGARTIRVPHRGPAVGRNVGAVAAKGEILVFADGDMSCHPEYVERLARPIAAGAAVGTFTADIFVGHPANAWARSYGAIRRLGFPRLLPESFPDRWDNFRAVSRPAFLAVGGYDDVGYGEDRTLAPKLGELALKAPGARCCHYHPDSPREIFENARWIGRGHDAGHLAHPVRDNLPTTALRRALRDIARGHPLRVLAARQIYSAGFLLGLADRRLGRSHVK